VQQKSVCRLWLLMLVVRGWCVCVFVRMRLCVVYFFLVIASARGCAYACGCMSECVLLWVVGIVCVCVVVQIFLPCVQISECSRFAAMRLSCVGAG